jgi:hypothetical protein
MAKVLNSISLDAPSSPVVTTVGQTFSFQGTPGFTGSGGVQRYDFKWEVDSGGGYVTIASSGTGLTTSDTNPLINTNSQSANSITVTASTGGTYTIRMSGAPTSGGSYTVTSSTQTVTVVVLPTVTTTTATNITSTSADSGGNVTSAGGGTVSARGVCWSTSANPTTADAHTTDGSGTGSYTSSITPLSGGTLYHYRAYATNEAGTAYGSDLNFTTDAPSVNPGAFFGFF